MPVDTVKLRVLLERATASAHHLSLPGDPSWSLYEAEKASAAQALQDAAVSALPALLDTIDAKQGWKLVPVEPTPEMIDRFVSRALCVSVHGDGGWSNYAREQWAAMLTAAPSKLHETQIAPSDPTIRHRGRG